MKISKISNKVTFGKKNKQKEPYKIKPNTKPAKDNLVTFGLVGAGTLATIVAIKKNNIDLGEFAKKMNLDGQNPKVKDAVMNAVSEKPAQTAQIEAEKVVSSVENTLDNTESEKAIDTVKEAISEAKDEAVSKTISQAEVNEAIALPTEEIVGDIQGAEIENVEKLTQQPAQCAKTVEEIKDNVEKNTAFIEQSKKSHSKLYKDFGIDEEIYDEFKKLDSGLVASISDDEFLSLLLAPTEKLSISLSEIMQTPPHRSKTIKKLENSVFGFTKKAKYNRSLDRRLRLNTVAKNILTTNDRIAKLQKMEESFSKEDISAIFNSDNKMPKNMLLSWLLEFHTKAKDEQLFNNIQNSLK